MSWCVYMHTHRESGKKYIGLTGRAPATRWANGSGYAGNSHFYAAIQKYGWDAFQHEILFSGLTKAEAERLEIELIAKYQTQDPAKGYNIAPGGFAPSASPATRKKMAKAQAFLWSTNEHREKMRAARLGHPVTEETREKIRQSNAGHPVSAVARQRMSVNHADMGGANNPRARAVVCCTTGTVYSTAAEAAKTCGAHKSDIAKCCKGKAKTAGGHRWRYHNEEPPCL